MFAEIGFGSDGAGIIFQCATENIEDQDKTSVIYE